MTQSQLSFWLYRELGLWAKEFAAGSYSTSSFFFHINNLLFIFEYHKLQSEYFKKYYSACA